MKKDSSESFFNKLLVEHNDVASDFARFKRKKRLVDVAEFDVAGDHIIEVQFSLQMARA